MREYLREKEGGTKEKGRKGREERGRESKRKEIIFVFPRQTMPCLLSILQPTRELWIFLAEGEKK